MGIYRNWSAAIILSALLCGCAGNTERKGDKAGSAVTESRSKPAANGAQQASTEPIDPATDVDKDVATPDHAAHGGPKAATGTVDSTTNTKGNAARVAVKFASSGPVTFTDREGNPPDKAITIDAVATGWNFVEGWTKPRAINPHAFSIGRDQGQQWVEKFAHWCIAVTHSLYPAESRITTVTSARISR